MSKKRKLTDRVICITGASSGIGRATALACAEAGMNVVVSARRLDRLRQLADEIEKMGRRSLAIACDVAEDDDVRRLIVDTQAKFGRLDAVMANAGYGLHAGEADIHDDDLRRIFEVNFFGTMRVIRNAVPLMRCQGHGHILITSSCLARFTLPYFGAYAATKAAQTQIARSLRLELEPENIDVSVVHPITTTTEFFDVSADMTGIARKGIPEHAPKWLVQSPQRVADAVVRCLYRPVPEVWTSWLVRIVAGFMTMSPRFHDLCVRGEAERLRAKLAENRNDSSNRPTVLRGNSKQR